MFEIARALCTSLERVALFRNLAAYRSALVAAGITGFQWINGSFCEDVETTRGRPPADVDLVTLLFRPPNAAAPADWQAFVAMNASLFQRAHVKTAYHCDIHSIDIGLAAALVIPQITYWFSLFTHQRVTFMWKGILQVPLPSDDNAALAYANALTFKS